jgi:nitrate/nitrite transport system ATP-binding protein
MSVYLRLDRLTKEFGRGRERSVAIQEVSLEVAQGEFVALIGHSGCGKSTVLNLVAGLSEPTTGQVLLDGKRVEGPGADRAMVFQSYSLLPWLTVHDNVYQAVDAVFGELMPRHRKREATERCLRMVGLWDHRTKRPAQLSGGMRQRVSIARAFSVQPRVLLLDEPFGALDALTKGSLHEELLAMWSAEAVRRPQTVMMVTHDIDEAIYLSDRIVVMGNGPAATIAEVIPVPLERPRDKRALMHDRTFVNVKERLLELLEEGFTKPQYAAASRSGASAA